MLFTFASLHLQLFNNDKNQNVNSNNEYLNNLNLNIYILKVHEAKMLLSHVKIQENISASPSKIELEVLTHYDCHCRS